MLERNCAEIMEENEENLDEDNSEDECAPNIKLGLNVFCVNSHAVGMAIAQPLGFEIDFVRNLFSGSAT